MLKVLAHFSVLSDPLAARPVVKGDETTAAILMLANLDIKGAIITGDALHCNRRMAKTIIDREDRGR
ncbi:MAG: hypothetical protein ACT4N2_12220 [Hyphomicrobium sp.]